ncbi:Zn(II)2Cys6 transcription factor [Aspergillus lucknowensis]|uniref:Zn(2)-C6 fungal-type domain-containing protein n=1 Tax=Aspergillus lucknowensis TaxID=176173 RepID=A0ABR4LYZ2_9EURO
MPPRRSHTKSRYGCDQCKKRRVKCDERGPPCSNCIARELECYYSKTPMAGGSSNISVSPTPGQSHNGPEFVTQPRQREQATHCPSSGVSSAELRRLELMHKFSTETYRSLCNSSSDFYIWQMVVPRKALAHDFLMNGLLAVASLHMASSMDPSAATSYINTALEFHNQTLTPFRHAIDDINTENCDAVFAHAVVTTVIEIALPQLTTERDERASMVQKIILAAELLQGVSKILSICRPWMQLKLFSSAGDFWDQPNIGLDGDTEAALNNLSSLVDGVTDTDHQSLLRDALNLLRLSFNRYANSRDLASVLAWTAAVSKEFVDALKCRQPLPLLVLTYWGVLLHELHGKVWWTKNSGLSLVLELLAELRSYDPRWESILRWPEQRIDTQGHSIHSNGAGAETDQDMDTLSQVPHASSVYPGW